MTATSRAHRAGQGTPTSDKARDTPHAAGPIHQHTHTHSAARAEDDQHKAIATARACAALAGFTMHSARRARWTFARIEQLDAAPLPSDALAVAKVAEQSERAHIEHIASMVRHA